MVNREVIRLFVNLAPYLIYILIAIIAIYVYLSVATMVLARKTGTKHGWLAWIPIANFYLYSKMAGMHWWPLFLLVGIFIPYLEVPALLAFAVFNIVWFWKIFAKAGKPGWWSLFPILLTPGWIIFLVFIGVAAWSPGGNRIEQMKLPTEMTQQPTKKQTQRKPQKTQNTDSRKSRINKLKGSLK